MQEAGPVLSASVGEEGELGDNQECRLHLDCAQVELPCIVAEYPQLQDLVGQVIGIALSVGVGRAQQNAVPRTDRRLAAVPLDRCLADALDHRSHHLAQGGGFQPVSWASVRCVSQLSMSWNTRS